KTCESFDNIEVDEIDDILNSETIYTSREILDLEFENHTGNLPLIDTLFEINLGTQFPSMSVAKYTVNDILSEKIFKKISQDQLKSGTLMGEAKKAIQFLIQDNDDELIRFIKEYNKKNKAQRIEAEIQKLIKANQSLTNKIDLQSKTFRKKDITIQLLREEVVILQLKFDELYKYMNDLEIKNNVYVKIFKSQSCGQKLQVYPETNCIHKIKHQIDK
ncbi:30792_t:CDS:2, partial [Racocetra persica]